MKSDASITRRLTLSVLVLEVLAAVVLIATVTNHERQVRFETFDANLRASANELLGAVQEADSMDGSVRLDLTEVNLPPQAAFRVLADQGQVLGERGIVPSVAPASGKVSRARVNGHPFRFYVLRGDRIIDPNSSRAVTHHVTIIYGLPEGRAWQATFNATRYFAMATAVLLGVTAIFMFWLVRRLLRPIRELALKAGTIDATHLAFDAPESSKRFLELRPLASAIEETTARLHRSFEQQRRFTSDAAHELKTDLAIIKSSFQVLAMKRRSVEEYEQGLNVGLDDIGRLESTVQRMLTLARLEQNRTAEQAHCDFNAALSDAVAQSQSYAEIKYVTVLSQNTVQQVQVMLDMEDAVLLCSNVLVNAIQHSPENGHIEVLLQSQRGCIELRVRDHGPGIAAEDIPFLFDPFYRGDASRSRKSGGTGLGLSICKAICDRAGGVITIANRADGGAEVVIRLPLTDPSNHSAFRPT